ncbi:hypothetical protein NF212_18695 [Parasalinivibrio latis]|uniref:hypothetical protein n=1 Tax=Parasalinivibrio latis TaxID=2952610 RepID=UPI0030E0F5BC
MTVKGLIAVLLSGSATASEFRFLDTEGSPLSGVAVSMTQYGPSQQTPAPSPLEIHQSERRFTPYISVIQRGTEVTFVNDDDISHHIYSALGPKKFSFRLKAGEKNRLHGFDHSGAISLGCNVHDWMSGHLLVVDTPYFGFTDNKGKTDFRDLPAGKYQLSVWHPQLEITGNSWKQDIQVPLKTPVTFHIPAEMSAVPEQRSLDDFDFLDNY